MPNRLFALFALTLVAAGCALVPGGKTPAPTTSPVPTQTSQPSATPVPPTTAPTPSEPAPSTAPSPSALPAGFYLRAWYTQSIAPQYTFSWLPPVTIAEGQYINGNVAVPAIYPGPLMIVPVSRSISDAGSEAIAAEAQRLGLLNGDGDFTGGTPMPGAKLLQIELVIEGKTYELTGNPDLTIECVAAPCEGAPGSPEAYAAFWHDLQMLDTWLAKDLGDSSQYVPERVALLLADAADAGPASPGPNLVPWPLDVPLAEAGQPYGGAKDARCMTLVGEDLATMLPLLQSANQLTVFSDGDTLRQPTARVLVPGEPAPCDG